MNGASDRDLSNYIAIIGMSGRFPGADDVEQFWRNLRNGIESIAEFSDDDLRASGISPEAFSRPTYVRRRGVLSDISRFDAQFFGYSPREAELMDPQQRLFLESAWAAFEDAGYNPESCRGPVGVFAGSNLSTYLIRNLLTNPATAQVAASLQAKIGNDKDFLPTLVSYKMNLHGPSLAVQSACSTSLVAVWLACQSLLNWQCDMAVAGSVSLVVPDRAGYSWERGIFSEDGRCRAFDCDADGTVGGDGVGAVVLKRLEDAIRDRDAIRAVILSSAINNDGAWKVGYTAPSLDAQVEVIARAHALAGIDPDTISYIETHGTATPLGDVIEVKALSEAFQMATSRKGFCAIGSVKTNVGHLDIAAGIAGLTKAVLALEHAEIPSSLNFKHPNPEIEFAGTPFYVNTRLCPWPAAAGTRRAGVSSFGIGGTNVHLVLEEAPPPAPAGESRAAQLIVLSARTPLALEKMTDRLAEHLADSSEMSLADVAYTCHAGRKAFLERRYVVGRTVEETIVNLRERNPKFVYSGRAGHSRRPVAFLFPGLGNQYINMGLGLYREEPVFRKALDTCAEILRPLIDVDLVKVLYPNGTDATPAPVTNARLDLARVVRGERAEDAANPTLNQTIVVQPAMFAVEYALSRVLFDWGIKPHCVVGHSLGEYVAACVAGVFSFEDALTLVALRAKLIQSRVPEGGMLATTISEAEAQRLLERGLSISAVNGEALTVIGGPKPLILELERELKSRGVACRILSAAHAFHSKMMEPVAHEISSMVSSFRRSEPCITLLSNVTGKPIKPQEAIDPEYWSRHLVATVRFADCVRELMRESDQVLVEVGPGQDLSAWTLQLCRNREIAAFGSLRHELDPKADLDVLLRTVGRLWIHGVPIDWDAFYAGQQRRRCRLPSYPFERQRYWVEPGEGLAVQRALSVADRPQTSAPAVAQHARPVLQTAYVPPRDLMEIAVATMWAQLLAIEKVGIHDNFFELGGHSLMAVQMLSRIRDTFGVELSLKDVFGGATVAEVCACIRGQRDASSLDEDIPRIRRLPRTAGTGVS